MANPPLPKYVLRGSEQAFQQPYISQLVQLYAFLLKSHNPQNLVNLCNTLINDPTGGQLNYQPVRVLNQSFILLSFANMIDLSSIGPNNPDNIKEHFTYQEVILWVLTENQQTKEKAWLQVYLFLNCGPAMATGREVYGFPKQMAWPNVPSDGDSLHHFSLDVLGVKRYPTTEIASRQRLITLDKNRSLIPRSLAMGATKLTDKLFGLTAKVPSDSSLIFLKQFRDVMDGSRACYQAVAKVTTQSQTHDWGVLGFYTANFAEMASQPILNDFGLLPQQRAFGLWTTSTLTLGPGEILWQA